MRLTPAFALLVVCLLQAMGGFAWELRPWYEKDLYLWMRPWFAYQGYSELHTDRGGSGADDIFTGLSAFTSYDRYSVEAEIWLGRGTSYHSFGFEASRLTMRYRWLNDISGDPISLVLGASTTLVANRALRDPTTLYHGNANFEAHLSLGHEFSNDFSWCSRWWLLTGVGQAEQGSPWLHGIATWEYSLQGCHRLWVLSDFNMGFGARRLKATQLDGYGNIRYRILDIAVGYSRLLNERNWRLEGEYRYRPYAREAPVKNHQVAFSLLIPFGLGI